MSKATAKKYLEKNCTNIIDNETWQPSEYYEVSIDELHAYHKAELSNDCIKFAEWLNGLSASQKCSVWSKDGSMSGLYQMDGEQLYEKWVRLKNK